MAFFVRLVALCEFREALDFFDAEARRCRGSQRKSKALFASVFLRFLCIFASKMRLFEIAV